MKIVNASTNESVTITRNFYIAIDSASATPPTSVVLGLSASVQSGGPDYSLSPADVNWSITGNTANPTSGSLSDGTGTQTTLDTSSGNYNFTLTATAGYN
ncbi:MAG: hypothetical protein HKL95_08245, partial [Phycisphaerae bacterium]|nr:hypothetical protein [Phycisphaerae bacterium]